MSHIRRLLVTASLFAGLSIAALSIAHAQPRVLILHSSSAAYGVVGAHRIDSVTHSVVEHVDTTSTLPADLTPFSAILIAPAPALSSNDKLRLIDYMKSGGAMYIEVTDHVEPDTLLSFIGVQNIGADEAERSWSAFRGVPGTFTESFDIKNPGYDPLISDIAYGLHVFGQLQAVLVAEGNLSTEMAWVPSDTTVRAVLAWPSGKSVYDEFLRLVLCDYFNVCSASVRTGSVTTANWLRADGRTQILSSSALQGSLLLYDEAGRIVLAKRLLLEDHVNLPHDLPSGVYYARYNDGKQFGFSRFVLQ